jgi:hypothetical protein
VLTLPEAAGRIIAAILGGMLISAAKDRCDAGRGTAMADETTVRLCEFQALRQEISNRLTISYTLLALGLAAFGTGISVVGRTSQILAVLAAISSILWLYWTDNSLSIRRIAAYIAIELAPADGEGDWGGGLGWEMFLRQITLGGPVAQRALFKDAGKLKAERIHPAQNADSYTTVLFGGASPILLFLYVRANLHRGAGVAVWPVAGACLLVWAFAVLQFIRFVRERHAYDNAIATSSLAMKALNRSTM